MNYKIKSNHKDYKKKKAREIYKQFEDTKKRAKEIEKKSYLEALSNNLKLPSDILVGAPILTATGKNQVCLENYKGIIEYNGNIIRVQTKVCKIYIEGKDLNIDYFTDEEMRISGIIHAVRYV